MFFQYKELHPPLSNCDPKTKLAECLLKCVTDIVNQMCGCVPSYNKGERNYNLH